MLIARDAAQAKRSMTYATLLFQVTILCAIWAAILVLADRPGLMPNEVAKYIFDTHAYFGLKGFFIIGVIALAMSTADSTINATTVVIANDVLPPLKLQKEGSLRAAKYATLFLGGFAVLLALYEQGLLRIILLSACFYSPIVTVPMMLAIFGFETSRRVVLMAMGVGAVTVTACLIAFKSVNSFFPGMIANLVVMLGAHYLLGEEGGWGNNPLSPKVGYASHLTQREGWKSWIETAKRFQLSSLERTLPAETYFYSLFGFYIFTSTYASFYLLPEALVAQFSIPVQYRTIFSATSVHHLSGFSYLASSTQSKAFNGMDLAFEYFFIILYCG